MVSINKLKQICICAALLPAALSLLLHPEISAAAITRGLSVCAGSILPVMFPFFVLSELWISLGYSRRLSRMLAPWLNRWFHLPGPASSALLMGAVGGYPAGAQTIARLYRENLLSRQDAEGALRFCSNAGPAFIFGIIGGGLFQSAVIGAVLWGIHLGTALLIGLLFRSRDVPDSEQAPAPANTPFLPALTEAIRTAGQTTLQICVFVLFFSVLSEYLSSILPGTTAAALFLGSLELAGGCTRLGSLQLSQETVFVCCSGLLGWGGFCVHCQTAALLYEAGLSPKSYLFGKALHAVVSIAAACLAAPLLPLQVPCFAGASRPPVEEVCLLISLLGLLLLKSSSGKMSEHRI